MQTAALAQAASFLLLAACLSQQLPVAAALSFPLCERSGQVWVTKDPRRDRRFPGADLYCERSVATDCRGGCSHSGRMGLFLGQGMRLACHLQQGCHCQLKL